MDKCFFLGGGHVTICQVLFHLYLPEYFVLRSLTYNPFRDPDRYYFRTVPLPTDMYTTKVSDEDKRLIVDASTEGYVMRGMNMKAVHGLR